MRNSAVNLVITMIYFIRKAKIYIRIKIMFLSGFVLPSRAKRKQINRA